MRKKITAWIALLYFIGVTISLFPYFKSYINIQNQNMYAVVDFDKEPQSSFFEKYQIEYKEKIKDASLIEYNIVVPKKYIKDIKELDGVTITSYSTSMSSGTDESKIYDLFYKLFVEPIYLVPAILYVISIIYLLIFFIKKGMFKLKK